MNRNKKSWQARSSKGFTLVEILIAMAVMIMVASLSISALGFLRFNSVSVAGGISERQKNQACINRLSQYVMPASKVAYNGEEDETRVKVWHDINVPPTNAITDDDVEGSISFDPQTGQVIYTPDNDFPDDFAVVAEEIEDVDFSVIRNVLYADFYFRPRAQGDKVVKMSVSLAARNFPK